MKNIILNLPEDPYSGAIRQFLVKQFPVQIGQPGDLLDSLTDAIVATGQVRFGPKPPPESMVAIRQVLLHNITEGVPIRIVSPWGSEKPNGSGIDVAELMAIKTFDCLNNRVRQFYSPGIDVRLRVEDASAPHLFFERYNEAMMEAALYTGGLKNLVEIMDLRWLAVANELQFVSHQDIESMIDFFLPTFERHLTFPSDPKPLIALEAAGWKGGAVTPELVGFYSRIYDKLYAGMPMDAKLHRVARYLAGALARRKLGLSGAKPEWKQDYIEIYFGNTPPGQRLPVHSRRIHYRVMPSFITSNHMAPWRAKGYLRVGESEVSASVTSWQDNRTYNPFTIEFSGDGNRQIVQADYIIQP